MYLLDANVFIQAKNLHYGFDFVPAFWDWLIRENSTGKVASVEKVADELRVGRDELSEWAEERGEGFFLRPDANVATFLQVVDLWLFAHAQAHNCVVVTHEIPASTIRKIKIPNACIGLRLRCINPFQMLRENKARFVLG